MRGRLAPRFARRSTSPIVLLTSQTLEAEAERAMPVSPFHYLKKPVSELDLAVAIEVAVHKHGVDHRLLARETGVADADCECAWGGLPLRSGGAVADYGDQ